MHTRFRMYLVEHLPNGQRREMTEHPAHGAEWCASGRMAYGPDGYTLVPGTVASAEGCKGETYITVTASEFAGRDVRLKQWHPNGGTLEYRRFAEDAAAPMLGRGDSWEDTRARCS